MESDACLAALLRERQKSHEEGLVEFVDEIRVGRKYRDITCEDLYNNFGPNYISELTTFTKEEVDEILAVCKETLTQTGPGRRIRDLKCRLIVYLVWLTSGWTIKRLALLLKMKRATVQRSIDYMMSGLTDSLTAKYIPASREDIKLKTRFQYFPEAIGAVDSTIVEILKPTDRDLDKKYYSGKHHYHGVKAQVLVSPDGYAIHIAPLKPGKRHDSRIFRKSGLDKFLEKRGKGKRSGAEHPQILCDAGYIGLTDIYPELIVPFKRPPKGELTKSQSDFNSRLHHDRALVENYFGFLKGHFRILKGVYRASIKSLEHVIPTCICLSNVLLRRMPLRAKKTPSEDSGSTSITPENSSDFEDSDTSLDQYRLSESTDDHDNNPTHSPKKSPSKE